MRTDPAGLAAAILSRVGGPDNVTAVAHCMTRLRLGLADPARVEQKALRAVPGVLGLVVDGDAYQVVLGPGGGGTGDGGVRGAAGRVGGAADGRAGRGAAGGAAAAQRDTGEAGAAPGGERLRPAHPRPDRLRRPRGRQRPAGQRPVAARRDPPP
ncbi:hypothetical protein GCM10020295_46490 [Streptomyces cinereospinus]